MNQDYYIQLIYQKLAGEIPPVTEKELQTWLAQDKQNSQLMQEIELAWKASEGYKANLELDLDSEFAQLLERREIEARRRRPKIVRMQQKSSNLFRWSIAASILLVVFAGLLLFLKQNNSPNGEFLQYAAKKDKDQLQLADGTKIILQKDAIVVYPEKFEGAKRAITLEGTAFFDVAHNPKQPFEITTDIGTIEVLGTSFYLSSNKKQKQMQLKVETGKVKMQAEGIQESLIVTAGEQAVADLQYKKIKKVDALKHEIFSWNSGVYRFHDDPLYKVLKTMEEVYQTTLELEYQHLSKCPFTITFNKKQPIGVPLSIIEQVFEMKATQKDTNTYSLRGGSCP